MKYMATEYGLTPQQVDELVLVQMCILLGAVTPDHRIVRLPPNDYMRFTRDARSREIMRRIHHR